MLDRDILKTFSSRQLDVHVCLLHSHWVVPKNHFSIKLLRNDGQNHTCKNAFFMQRHQPRTELLTLKSSLLVNFVPFRPACAPLVLTPQNIITDPPSWTVNLVETMGGVCPLTAVRNSPPRVRWSSSVTWICRGSGMSLGQTTTKMFLSLGKPEERKIKISLSAILYMCKRGKKKSFSFK